MLTSVVEPQVGWLPRLRGKIYSLRHGIGAAPQSLVDATARYEARLRRDPSGIGHVLYGEHYLRYLITLGEPVLRRTVITLHQPLSQWSEPALAALVQFPHRIVLCHSLRNELPTCAGGTTHVVLHGVETEFFRPAPTAPASPRVLYSGVHLRNLAMLERVVKRLMDARPKLRIDMLVPQIHRSCPEFQSLARLPGLEWHAGLDEQRLLALYHASSAMILPMADSGANTAVVEALACGLPVVTTDVGGIRDYGGGSVYPLVANDDDDAMVAAVLRLVDDQDHRAASSAAARRFAVERLNWRKIADQHLEAYARVA
jgi:glycosyltransferase involved in cell wall biosynthesis